MHERFAAGDINLKYEVSSRMAADVYTKAFVDADKWRVGTWLINVCDPRILAKAANYALQEPEAKDLPEGGEDHQDDAVLAAATPFSPMQCLGRRADLEVSALFAGVELGHE